MCVDIAALHSATQHAFFLTPLHPLLDPTLLIHQVHDSGALLWQW